jgi:probable lipoprotein NlpC
LLNFKQRGFYSAIFLFLNMNRNSFLTFVVFATFITAAHAQMIPVSNSSGKPLSSAPDIVSKYAALLNVPKDSITNVKLYIAVEQFSNAPYKYDGNDANGIDCSGFTCAVEKQAFGFNIPRSSSAQLASAKPRTLATIKAGDLVFLKSHTVGLYLQNGYFAEVISNGGLILNNANDPDQQQRIASYGAVK